MMLVRRRKLRMSNAGGLEPLLSLRGLFTTQITNKCSALPQIVAATPRGAGEAICTSKTHNFARRKGKDEEYQTAKPGKLEKLLSPLN